MNRYWTLTDAPLGALPEPHNFHLAEGPIPTPGPGQALIRTLFVSLDPYQWHYKKKGLEAAGPPCHARTVGQVIESRMPGFTAGDFVLNTSGWAEYGLIGEGVDIMGYMAPRRIDPAKGRISYALSVLGMPGLTAYAGMILQCDPKAGETVAVSAASGGVGQIAGQLAKLRGARVVGIAGQADKLRYVVEELGFDACVSHRSPTLAADLAAATPDGVDCYFENVGGPVFEAVRPRLNRGARMSLCGVISQYLHNPDVDGRADFLDRNGEALAAAGVSLHNLAVGQFVPDHQDDFLARMADWLASGQVRYREDMRSGFEVLPAAFGEMMRGGNFGKALVQVADDPTAR